MAATVHTSTVLDSSRAERRRLGKAILAPLKSTPTQRHALKVQLVHPPGLINEDALGTLTPCLPLGLAFVAAALQDADFPVSIIDAVGEAPDSVAREGRFFRIGLGRDEIVDRIDDDTAVVAISAIFSFLWPSTRELIKEIRKARPDLTIVCGGEHLSALPEFSLEEAPLDFVVCGEGEATAVELMDALACKNRNYAGIPGIAWRHDGTIAVNPSRERVRDIADMPWPAWDLFDIDAYERMELVNGLHTGRTIPILATRGCPYKCSFCSSPGMWTRLWVPRDPVDVVDEIETYVRKYGASNFPFHDLTAIIRKDWIVRFCSEILARGLDIVWQFPSGTRCEAIDNEVASLLYKSGGRHICYAPESGSERTRKLIHKQMTTEGLINSVEASIRSKLNITILLILGFPHDTVADILETAKLARRLAWEGVDDLGINFFFPLPNTELYHELILEKRIHLDDGLLLLPLRAMEPKLREENNFCKSLSAWQLTLAKYWILLNFYPVSFLTHPSKVLRIIRNFLVSKEETKLQSFLLEVKRRLQLVTKSIPRPKQASNGHG